MNSPLKCNNQNCICGKYGAQLRCNQLCTDTASTVCQGISSTNSQTKTGTQMDACTESHCNIEPNVIESTFQLLGPHITNLGTILYDIVGVIAFFVMVTTIFWISASLQVKRLIVQLYYAPRKTQIIVGVMLAFFLISLTIHSIIAVHQKKAQLKLDNKVEERQKSQKSCTKAIQTETTDSSNTSILRKYITLPQIFRKRCSRLKGGSCPISCSLNKFKRCKSSSKYGATKSNNLAAHNLCLTLADKAKKTPMSDDEGLEIYRTYRAYSYPLDMKTPPALLIYIKDFIFNYICPQNQNIENI